MNDNELFPERAKIPAGPIIGAIGVIAAALIHYYATVVQVSVPIEATQTAEAIRTKIALEIQGSETLPISTRVPLKFTPTITLVSPTPESTPTTVFTQTSQAENISIENIAFCEIQFFDSESSECLISQQGFQKGITTVYVSWKYVGKFSGTYNRKWYYNDNLMGIYTHVGESWSDDVFTYSYDIEGFKVGLYTLKFSRDDNNQLIGEANFVIQ